MPANSGFLIATVFGMTSKLQITTLGSNVRFSSDTAFVEPGKRKTQAGWVRGISPLTKNIKDGALGNQSRDHAESVTAVIDWLKQPGYSFVSLPMARRYSLRSRGGRASWPQSLTKTL